MMRSTDKFFPISMRALIVLTVGLSLFSVARPAHAREGKAISIIGMGNIMIVESDPDLQIGPGGGVSFEYGFNDRFSLETTVFVTTHDGEGDSDGDNGIEFLGIPTADVHYHFLADTGNWDPYVGAGLGVYALSEGSQNDGLSGVGLGGQFILGVDYYISERFSVGFSGTFRGVAIITGTDSSNGKDNGTAVLPYTLAGKVGFHF